MVSLLLSKTFLTLIKSAWGVPLLAKDFTPSLNGTVGVKLALDQNTPKKQTPKSLKRLKIKSTFKSARKRFRHSRRYQKVRLMYQDEAGFGRISKLGKCWAPQGVRPIVASHHIREFRYCYGVVDAHTGQSFFLIAGGCNTEWMNECLRGLSEKFPDDYIVLVMDNAVWHKSRSLVIPHNIEFAFIPPYTPEMNPIEQVWAEIRKRGFKKMKSLISSKKWLEACIGVL